MIRQKLRDVRESQGLNYSEVAQKVGISTVGYWQIENGKRGASYSTMVKLAQVFGMKPDDLFLQSELTKS